MASDSVKKRHSKPLLVGPSVAEVEGFALVRVRRKKKAAAVLPEDRATALVAKLGRALKNPGIDRGVVFGEGQTDVFSYSAYPADPSKLVREAADGTKRIGRLVGGKFVPTKAV
jgi:hypothetical protein